MLYELRITYPNAMASKYYFSIKDNLLLFSFNIIQLNLYCLSMNYFIREYQNNNNDYNYNFYIVPTLYDTLQRFTLKLLPSPFDE